MDDGLKLIADCLDSLKRGYTELDALYRLAEQTSNKPKAIGHSHRLSTIINSTEVRLMQLRKLLDGKPLPWESAVRSERGRTYIATAYRWGWYNAHNYLLYVGTDKAKAVSLAQSEAADRGGKYGCVVCEYTEDAGGEMQSQQVAYFPSIYDEKALHHNHRIDYFETLGHKFDRFAEGFSTHVEDHPTMTSKDGKPMRVVKEHPVKPPEWVVQERDRAKEMCDFMTKMADELRAKSAERSSGG